MRMIIVVTMNYVQIILSLCNNFSIIISSSCNDFNALLFEPNEAKISLKLIGMSLLLFIIRDDVQGRERERE